MKLTYHGKTLVLYHCENVQGDKAVVLATNPEQAKRVLQKEGLGEYITATLMGCIHSRPTIISLHKNETKETPDKIYGQTTLKQVIAK